MFIPYGKNYSDKEKQAHKRKIHFASIQMKELKDDTIG